jgi:hypothetical protein
MLGHRRADWARNKIRRVLWLAASLRVWPGRFGGRSARVRFGRLATRSLLQKASAGHPVQGVSSIRTPAKKDRVFVHVFDWPRGPLEINGFQGRALSAHLVASGQPLKIQESEGKLRIELPPDPNISVIALRV